MNKGFFKLFFINACIWIAVASYGPFLPSYYAQQGIPPQNIGILISIGPLLSMLIEPLWARLSDVTGRRKVVLIMVTLGSAATVILFAFGKGFYGFLLANFIFMSFQTAIVPLSDPLFLQTTRKAGLDYGKIRMGGTTGYSIVAFILGIVLPDKTNIIFFLGAFFYLLLAIVFLMLPGDEKKVPVNAAERKERKKGPVFNSRQIILVLFLAFIVQIGVTICGNFISVYYINLGYGQSIVGMSNTLSALSELPVLFFAHKLIKRYGAIPLMLFAPFTMALRLLLASSGIIPIMLFSQVIHGMSYMISYFSCITYISENVIKDKISQGQSYMAFVQTGLGTILGSIVGGRLMGIVGIPHTFKLIAVMTLVGGVCCLIIYLYKQKKIPIKT